MANADVDQRDIKSKRFFTSPSSEQMSSSSENNQGTVQMRDQIETDRLLPWLAGRTRTGSTYNFGNFAASVGDSRVCRRRRYRQKKPNGQPHIKTGSNPESSHDKQNNHGEHEKQQTDRTHTMTQNGQNRKTQTVCLAFFHFAKFYLFVVFHVLRGAIDFSAC